MFALSSLSTRIAEILLCSPGTSRGNELLRWKMKSLGHAPLVPLLLSGQISARLIQRNMV